MLARLVDKEDGSVRLVGAEHTVLAGLSPSRLLVFGEGSGGRDSTAS